MMKKELAAAELAPWKLYLVILAIVFVSEFCVMLILPKLPLTPAPVWLVGAVDATMLTLLLVPLFGWLIVRPLQYIVRVRADLLQQFLVLQEEERGRIARDLHDEIGQSFTSVLIGLRTTDLSATTEKLRSRLNELADMVTYTLEEVRRLARGLRPAVLDHLGLVRAMEQYLEDYQAAHGIEVEFVVDGVDPEHRLPLSIETAVYRIVQESLTNAARHAGASLVGVSMEIGARQLNIEIADNGCGFSDQQIRAKSGTGVLGMAQRAALLRGSLRIDSRQGKGSRILLQIPLAQGQPT